LAAASQTHIISFSSLFNPGLTLRSPLRGSGLLVQDYKEIEKEMLRRGLA
jgi:hypothetical protein